MRCNWCGKGKGSNRTKDQYGKTHYYVCVDCVGLFIEQQNAHAKALLEGKTKICGICEHIHSNCEISKCLREEMKNWVKVIQIFHNYFRIESLAEVCINFKEKS